jgi:pilus assembly protein CpaB
VLAQSWLEEQSRLARAQPTGVKSADISTTKIVVATAALRYGTELTSANTNEIDWPARVLPVGAFASRAELFKTNERRVVLSAIEPNEPILKWKITGPGQRASLSALIQETMKAVTIRVNDVLGVAGFVLPGDRVDILLTKIENAQGEGRKSFADVLLQNIRVLGVDQQADDRSEKAAVVKAVTVEVDTEEAQKLALAQTVGTLSLALRNAGSLTTGRTERITVDDLGRRTVNPVTTASIPVVTKTPEARVGVVNVTRGIKKSDYSVAIEKE